MRPVVTSRGYCAGGLPTGTVFASKSSQPAGVHRRSAGDIGWGSHAGLNAVRTKPSTGRGVTYNSDLRAQVLAEYRRAPDRDLDGTGTWSLTTLQRAVRRRKGLEQISRDTISKILRDAGLTWQRDRTWCDTGISIRKGKHGQRVVVDVDAEAKKS